MKVRCRSLAFLFLSGLGLASTAFGQPLLSSAKFDSQGRLVATVQDVTAEGCYVTILGGLSSSTITTAIVSTQVTSAQAAADKVNIKTRRRYFCRKRTLHVQAEVTCVTDPVYQDTSNKRRVSVPSANVR